MKENVLLNKSKLLALRIIRLYQYLCEEKKEFVLSKQVLRSGTSIGANIREANRSQSKKEFIAKLNISLKEADETMYWLELLHERGVFKILCQVLLPAESPTLGFLPAKVRFYLTCLL